MQEIEVKILEIDVPQIKDKLIALGAEKVFSGAVRALSFDKDNFLQEKRSFLRLRTLGEGVIELCFKGPKEDSEFKIREEVQITTNDFPQTLLLLEKLGFSKTDEKTKQRESYKLRDVRFEIDTFPNIPALLEIEAPSKEQVKEYVEKLGFTMEQATNMSGNDVITHYEKMNNKLSNQIKHEST